MHRLENSWRSVLISVLFAGLATVVSRFTAFRPCRMAGPAHTLLDGRLYDAPDIGSDGQHRVERDKLPPARKRTIAIFLKRWRRGATRRERYRLVFRDAQPSSNAFALPTGR